jgi:hypothetical protein
MIAGALIAFGPAIFGIVAIERWRRRISRHCHEAEVRSLRSREAWEAVAEYDVRRAA